MSPTNKDNEKMKRLEAQVRREREKWDQSYRGQALKILPHICSHCGREFTGKRLKELTEDAKSPYYDLALSPTADDFEKGPVKAPADDVVAVPGRDKA